ncbi:hypothetical protein TWF694_000957 [Orbilia ellipsospora]|uniref:Uncharacterized protein n=1 Tax=Orbilia ellipsospora TaxID=2528407 RepID=A0AAV9XQ51_9PEZI
MRKSLYRAIGKSTLISSANRSYLILFTTYHRALTVNRRKLKLKTLVISEKHRAIVAQVSNQYCWQGDLDSGLTNPIAQLLQGNFPEAITKLFRDYKIGYDSKIVYQNLEISKPLEEETDKVLKRLRKCFEVEENLGSADSSKPKMETMNINAANKDGTTKEKADFRKKKNWMKKKEGQP